MCETRHNATIPMILPWKYKVAEIGRLAPYIDADAEVLTCGFADRSDTCERC
jgi:hypothetical protein